MECISLVTQGDIKWEQGLGQAGTPWEISILTCVQQVDIDPPPLELWGSFSAWIEAFAFQTE